MFLLLPLLAFRSGIVEWTGPSTHQFGDIVQGEPVQHTFEFVNMTDEPLLIDNVRVACGCTGTEWSKAPVAPRDTGRIIVEYDARDPGYFRKYVKVYFNQQRRAEKLYIEGYVE